MRLYEEDKGTLYVLGNGFDICHGLDTSPERFLEILKTKEIYNETETAEIVFARYNVLWGDYESCLADIDLEEIAEEQMIAPDYLSDHEYDRDGGIFNMEQYTESLRWAIQESLKTMVDNANSELVHKRPMLRNFLNPNDAVLSFNYTSTLEQLYVIPESVQVCHIHGFRDNGERLLLGFRDGISEEEYYNKFFDKDAIKKIKKQIKNIQEEDTLSEDEKESELQYWYMCLDNLTGDRDFYIDTQREVVYQFYQSLKKEIQIDKLKKFLENCKGIERVVVMGHSMSSVDGDYMEMIEKILRPREWRISQYNNNPSEADVSEYSFAENVQFYELAKKYLR